MTEFKFLVKVILILLRFFGLDFEVLIFIYQVSVLVLCFHLYNYCSDKSLIVTNRYINSTIRIEQITFHTMFAIPLNFGL